MTLLTIDLDRLAEAFDAQDRLDRILDLETGEIRAFRAESLPFEEQEALESRPDRYVAIPRLNLEDRIALREAFLQELREPHAHPLLTLALSGRKPLRTFDYELEQFPAAQTAWSRFQTTRLREDVLAWLAEQGVEPGAGHPAQTPDRHDIPKDILRRLKGASL
ncbi:UPF0158 family protein [Pseudomonas matsuisoli]|uniref:Uncharacterized protein n=1 Tax=Pseudomonas matsuisoli TaxID=1515666 RepID=A0A917Q171_9PSED|nr:UPF0158 family protein [Pseudomonas matsuisoli]GGK03844.1 hypothetical protein GCM10009304_32220 [Pseudomonas matsuisoli]